MSGEDSTGFCFPEYNRLKRVLMHSPGKELNLIRPASYRRYLFEDAVDPVQFRRQHEALVATLRTEGVDVVLLDRLLKTSPMANAIERSPNLVYTRDSVTVTPAGYVGMRMKSPVRRHEPRIMKAALLRLGLPKFIDIEPPATMEGGDLIFLDEDTLLVGVGNRTNNLGLRQLRQRAQQHGLRTLIAVRLPSSVIHLDGTMMILDRDLAIVHRQSLGKRAAVFVKGRPVKETNLLEILKDRGFHFVDVTGYERQRRATNVITLGPRKLVGYSGNARVRSMLTKEGVDFIETEGSELVRGGGGPRCMTAPIEREWCQCSDQAKTLSDGVP
jgi:arginine deiminase